MSGVECQTDRFACFAAFFSYIFSKGKCISKSWRKLTNYKPENRIPWLFTDFDNIKDFSWLFLYVEKFSFFPNFSLTVATLIYQKLNKKLLTRSSSKSTMVFLRIISPVDALFDGIGFPDNVLVLITIHANCTQFAEQGATSFTESPWAKVQSISFSCVKYTLYPTSMYYTWIHFPVTPAPTPPSPIKRQTGQAKGKGLLVDHDNREVNCFQMTIL